MSNLLLLQNTFSPWTIKVGCGQLRNSEIIALSVNKKGEFFPYELVFYPPENSSQSNSISYCGLARWVFCLIFFFHFAWNAKRKTRDRTIWKPCIRGVWIDLPWTYGDRGQSKIAFEVIYYVYFTDVRLLNGRGHLKAKYTSFWRRALYNDIWNRSNYNLPPPFEKTVVVFFAELEFISCLWPQL